jgi:hypothetical protein
MTVQPGRLVRFAVLLLVAGAGVTLSCLADTHIFAGATSTNQGAKLSFSNGFVFDANHTNTYFPQILRTNGLNADHYRGDPLTFAALSATVTNGGDIPGHAAVGTRLAIQVVSVEGPPGGRFEFWEGDGESDLGAITFSVPVGTSGGTNQFVISENQGEPGADPYGHIHGREFTTSTAGTYLVGFRAVDLSTNGPGGGPIQLPSDVLPVLFQAGIHADGIQVFSNRVTVSFRSPTAISNVLEAAASPESGWTQVSSPLRGNNAVQTLSETNAPSGNRFYRLRVLNNFP